MKKQLLKTALLATLPFVAIYADNNISNNDPFLNDPDFKHFQKMQEQMNKIMEEFNQDFFNDAMISPTVESHLSNGFNSSPNSDLQDKGDYYELKIDLAGMDDKNIKIDVKDNHLTVQAKSETKKEKKEGDKIIHQERYIGMVQRGIILPKDADAQNYQQEYKNGILTITVPKKK